MEKKKHNKELFNKRFIHAAEKIMYNNGKNIRQAELSRKLGIYPNVISELMNGTKNVTLPQLARIINEFDLNANYFLKEDNTGEEMKYNIHIDHSDSRKYGDINAPGATISGGNGFVQGDIYNVDNLVQQAPPELKAHIDRLERENEVLKSDVSDLKKIMTSQDAQIKQANEQIRIKDERLFQVQQELVQVYRDRK